MLTQTHQRQIKALQESNQQFASQLSRHRHLRAAAEQAQGPEDDMALYEQRLEAQRTEKLTSLARAQGATQPHEISRLVESIQADHQVQLKALHKRVEVLTAENKQLHQELLMNQGEMDKVCRSVTLAFRSLRSDMVFVCL